MAKKRNNKKRQHGKTFVGKPQTSAPVKKKRHETKSNFSSQIQFPQPYPKAAKFPLPEKSFLRPIDPYKKAFQTALETSYLGFEIDEEEETKEQKGVKDKSNNSCSKKKKQQQQEKKTFDHALIESALLTMDRHELFRTDVTQPFGLGTKCAKTYVTRCLLGEEGTTYKYLGLRMFAYPWRKGRENAGSETNTKSEEGACGDTMGLEDALGVISELNDSLTDRTTIHLRKLDETRKKLIQTTSIDDKNMKTVKGRAKFDVALINRMVNTSNLKKEPSMGDGRCSVSWHADSSLEHYSSIAVYHTILNERKVNEMLSKKNNLSKNSLKSSLKGRGVNYSEDISSDRWSIALRVAHNSEGPSSSKRGTAIESAVVTDTPPIAISLPSRSAYYLLDDFNHHHQHAVLVNDDDKNSSSAGVRFASTHRLLREGHNVHFMLNRCRNTCAQFHKKGPKLWRSEQLLLGEIEFEWIRQFFIQGEGHKAKLWKYWKEPICQLLMYWSRLEQRTKQVLDLLRYAAQERCRLADGGGKECTLKRKERDKQKKSLAAVEDILSRGSSDNSVNNNDALNSIYIPISHLLQERAHMRMMWGQREDDRVFKCMSLEYKPIKVPFQFNVVDSENKLAKKDVLKEIGVSPLGGSHHDLERMSKIVVKLGAAFMSQESSHLPDIGMITPLIEKKVVGDEIDTPSTEAVEIKREAQTKVITKEGNNEQGMALVTQDKIKMNPTEHTKDIEWNGWKKYKFGLEMQHPWAGLLLNGNKTIETRSYNLPQALLGKRIIILESQPGKDQVSSLGNILVGEEINESVKPTGWVIFDRVITYRYRSKFEADEKMHLVKRNSGYGWKEETEIVYGWVVGKKGKYKNSGKNKQKCPSVQSLIRRMRSLYSVELSEDSSKKKLKSK